MLNLEGIMAKTFKTKGKHGEKEVTIYKFKCNWPNCGYEFEQKVGSTTGGEGKHGGVTSQVQCPRCSNFIPSWSGK